MQNSNPYGTGGIVTSYSGPHEMYGAGSGDVLLGEYKTEARCLEILDEIQGEYSKSLKVCELAVPVAIYDYPKVYQMPEK